MSLSIPVLILIGSVILVLILIRPFWGSVVLLALLWLTPFYPDTGQLTLNRLVGLAALAGVMLHMFSTRGEKKLITSSFDYFFIYFVIVAIASLLKSMWSTYHDFPTERVVDMLMSYLLYWLIQKTVDSWAKLKTLFWVTIVCALAVCIPTILMGIRADALTMQRITIGGNPNYYADLFLFATILLIWLSVHVNALQKIVLYFLMSVLTVGIFFTGNRSCLLSLVFVMALYLLVARKIGIPNLLIVGLVILAGYWLVSQYTPFLAARSVQVFTQENSIDENNILRFLIYTTAFRIFMDHPILGVGLGNGIESMLIYMGLRVNIHNMFLAIAAETGVLGFAGILAMYYFVLKNLLKVWISSRISTLPSKTGLNLGMDSFHAMILIVGFTVIPNLTHGYELSRPWFVAFAFVVVLLGLIEGEKTALSDRKSEQAITGKLKITGN